MRRIAGTVITPLVYCTGLLLAHYAAKYTSRAFAMHGSDRFLPTPFPTHELCRDPSGQVTCNRARMGVGAACLTRCVIRQQMNNMLKSSDSSTRIHGRTSPS